MDYGKWANREIDRIAEPKGKTQLKALLADRLGIALSTLHARLRGDGAKFSSEEADKMAEVFGVESPVKTNGPHRTAPGNVVPLRPAAASATGEWIYYPVLGTVEAGAFREADMHSQVEPYSVPWRRSPIHPNATPMAWEAHGNSMNEEGINEGTILMGVDFNEAGGVLRNDMLVVVEQDRGGLIERSVKKVAIFPDRTEFQPRSTDPRHQPIIYKNGNHDEGIAVRILTVVHGFYRSA